MYSRACLSNTCTISYTHMHIYLYSVSVYMVYRVMYKKENKNIVFVECSEEIFLITGFVAINTRKHDLVCEEKKQTNPRGEAKTNGWKADYWIFKWKKPATTIKIKKTQFLMICVCLSVLNSLRKCILFVVKFCFSFLRKTYAKLSWRASQTFRTIAIDKLILNINYEKRSFVTIVPTSGCIPCSVLYLFSYLINKQCGTT